MRTRLTTLYAFSALFVLLILAAVPVYAQGNSLVAFVNTGGQLIVGSADGSYRWIMTNPGEQLAEPVGFAWSPDASRLFFAVNAGGEASLRVGTIATQSLIEIGRVPASNLSGGVWRRDGGGVFVGYADTIALFDANGGGATPVITGQGAVRLISLYGDDRPNLQRPSSLSADGQYLLFQQADGRYAIYGLTTGSLFALPGTNDAAARSSGLWSSAAPLVATWGYQGSAILNVTYAPTGATVTLDSGRSAPITPLAWIPGSTALIYRDATGFARVTDLACLASSCAGNPLQTGVELAPATATDIQTESGFAFYRDGDGIYAVSLSCLNAGNCLSSASLLGINAAPGTVLHISGGTLAYTSYTADPNNPADRAVNVIDLACLGSGGCQPIPVVSGAVAGLVSPDGMAVVIEGAAGLNAFNLVTFNPAWLSDYSGGQLLLDAQWR